MIMTRLRSGKYNAIAKHVAPEELIKEFTLAIRMLAQDVSMENEARTKEILQNVIYDIQDSYGECLFKE